MPLNASGPVYIYDGKTDHFLSGHFCRVISVGGAYCTRIEAVNLSFDQNEEFITSDAW
jgi:hypothetical protein